MSVSNSMDEEAKRAFEKIERIVDMLNTCRSSDEYASLVTALMDVMINACLCTEDPRETFAEMLGVMVLMMEDRLSESSVVH